MSKSKTRTRKSTRRRSKRPDVYQIITDRIVAALEAGTVPWHKPWKGADFMPKNLVSKKAYRGVNVFMLALAPFNSHWWLTFNQAKKLGGSVRKGEKGTPVVFWKWFPKKDENGDEIPGKRVPFLRYYTVFNLDQCEGIDAAKVPTTAEVENDFEPIEACEAIVAAYENAPKVTHSKRDARAYYVPSTDRINMPLRSSFDSAESYYATLFHELGHSTGHESRLGREGITDPVMFGSHKYSKEELVAEMTSAFLCGTAGIEDATIDNSAAYIDGWLKQLKSDPKLVVIAAAQGQKAADLIVGKSWNEATNDKSMKLAA